MKFAEKAHLSCGNQVKPVPLGDPKDTPETNHKANETQGHFTSGVPYWVDKLLEIEAEVEAEKHKEEKVKVAELVHQSLETHEESSQLGDRVPQNHPMISLKPIYKVNSGGLPSCVECGTTENLHVHHISYEPVIKEIRCQKCHAKIHNQEPNLSLAKTHYETLKDLEKLRIATENRIRSLKGFDIDTTFLKEELKTIKFLEKKANMEMIKAVEKNKIFSWLMNVDGIADKSAAMLVALMGDVDRFQTISSLWAYAGLGVENGEAPRRKKGNQIHYNPHLKSLCLGIIGGNFIRSKAEPQYQNYLDKKIFYEQNRDWKKLRRHRAAIRFVVKEFMKRLWLEWRRLENLPITEPYGGSGDR